MAATSEPVNDSGRQLLRHTLATLAYRAGKTLRDAPESFASFSTGEKGRTPAQILAHMGDLFDWALSIAQGKQAWHDSEPLPWPEEVKRFFRTLQAFDDYLASDAPLAASRGKAFSGPNCRRTHPYGTDRNAAPNGRLPHAQRELLSR